MGAIAGEPWVVIALSLWVHGPHCAYFNACSVGIETVWNGDVRAWTEPICEGLYLIHRALERRLGIPLRRGVTGPTNTNVPTSTGKGWLFHRDARGANKSCPGWMNTHAALQAALDCCSEEESEMNKEQDELLKLGRVSQVARSYDLETLKALLRELVRAMGGNPDVAAAIDAEKRGAVADERERLQLD